MESVSVGLAALTKTTTMKKITSPGWLINRDLLLALLEAGKPKFKALGV